MGIKYRFKKVAEGILKAITDWLRADIHPPRTRLSDFGEISRHLKPADVVLVEGRSRSASVIQAVTLSSWTHSVLYLGRVDDIKDETTREFLKGCGYAPKQQLILEAELGEGVIISPLTRYIREHLRLCRPSSLTPADAQKVIQYAVARVGMSYDVRQIFDLLRFFFPYGLLPRYWRSTLFSKGSGTLISTICSTLMAEAFSSVNYPILPRVTPGTDGKPVFKKTNFRLITPRDFDYSPYFDVVKYPFYGEIAHSYQSLNWSSDSDDEPKHQPIN